VKINRRRIGIVAVTGLLIVVSFATAIASLASPGPTTLKTNTADTQMEPKAGSWKTWILTSGSQFRLPAPPDKATTDGEIRQLKDMVSKRDAAALDQITFWDTSSPSYRWNEMAVNEALKKGFTGPIAWRMLSMMHVAVYDALVAAWDSKYTYNRARPSVVDPTLP
jgi:hypothetical protein